MPAGPAVAVGLERPLRLAGFRELPQREIEWILLELSYLDARTDLSSSILHC